MPGCWLYRPIHPSAIGFSTALRLARLSWMESKRQGPAMQVGDAKSEIASPGGNRIRSRRSITMMPLRPTNLAGCGPRGGAEAKSAKPLKPMVVFGEDLTLSGSMVFFTSHLFCSSGVCVCVAISFALNVLLRRTWHTSFACKGS